MVVIVAVEVGSRLVNLAEGTRIASACNVNQ